MSTVDTHYGPATFSVLIPTKGRDATLGKTLAKMPWLDQSSTVIGVDDRDWSKYTAVRARWRRISYLKVHNPVGSVAIAREQLRSHAMTMHAAKYYVVTDDNAVHKSEEALHNLVRCCHEYRHRGDLAVAPPVIMAGMHNTAPHFDRGKIGKARTVFGLRSYPTVAMIFQVYPHDVFSRYEYPADAYGLDDRHFFLWCIAQSITEFRVCMDAPFTKSRYQEGGQGDIASRMIKTGMAIERLAHDFPQLVGATGTLRIPWQFLLDMKAGATADRLVGGAMRTSAAITKTGTPVKVRRRKLTT